LLFRKGFFAPDNADETDFRRNSEQRAASRKKKEERRKKKEEFCSLLALSPC